MMKKRRSPSSSGKASGQLESAKNRWVDGTLHALQYSSRMRISASVILVFAASYLRVAFFAAGSAVKDEVAAIMAATAACTASYF